MVSILRKNLCALKLNKRFGSVGELKDILLCSVFQEVQMLKNNPSSKMDTQRKNGKADRE